MKLINKYALLAVLAIVVSCQLSAQAQTQVQSQVAAQEPNTSTRLIDQLKNGTAPGMKFASTNNNRAAVAEPAPTAAQTSETLVDQIRKGTAPGIQFARGGGSSSGVSTGSVANAPRGNGNLTSDKAAPVAIKTLTPVAAPALPTQGDATTNTKAPAAKVVKSL